MTKFCILVAVAAIAATGAHAQQDPISKGAGFSYSGLVDVARTPGLELPTPIAYPGTTDSSKPQTETKPAYDGQTIGLMPSHPGISGHVAGSKPIGMSILDPAGTGFMINNKSHAQWHSGVRFEGKPVSRALEIMTAPDTQSSFARSRRD